MSTGTSRVAAPDQIVPRPVFCVTGDVHNDRSVAAAVRDGRFTHIGITLDLGTEPDWLGADLPSDEEWRIEWSKFYYGLDLAHAFAETGDAGFLHAWERLVGSWIQQVPVESDGSDVAARRVQNWTYAWGMFAASPDFAGLADGLDTLLLQSIGQHARHIRRGLTPEVFRNHRVLEVYALLVVALAFPTLDDAPELLTFSIAELHRMLAEGFRPDGVHRESSTHYHLVALRSFLGARENARRFSLELPDDFDTLLERACEFALHCHRPDGVISALSDADSGSYPEVLRLAGLLFGRSYYRYAATEGAVGRPPATRMASFPDAGYFFQRSGWGDGECSYSDERFLVFDCGPLGDGGHGHYDALSVEVYAYGRPLLVDPGRYTYAEDGENLRRWFKGTAAHNTVCVDGMDQTPYRRGRPGSKVATGTFLGRTSVPGLDVLAGRVASPCYDAVHTRRVWFVDDEYWVVEDELAAKTEHRYDLRWHLPAEAWGATELTAVGGKTAVRAPGVLLVFLSAVSVELEPGWVSPQYGVKLRAPVVTAAATATDTRLTTLIVPLRPSSMRPTQEAP
ncbi:MAG TPA: alginate lyase family protein [Pseudonocardiaceae bacterium]|nr:alginate lyase family protein [Pseudonocardiaceae bacterium]